MSKRFVRHDCAPVTDAISLQKKLKELLIRLLYVEMLGHDASFGYIKAVEFTAATNLLQKRVGYLCASLTLSPEHEFRFMLINQLQRVSRNSLVHSFVKPLMIGRLL